MPSGPRPSRPSGAGSGTLTQGSLFVARKPKPQSDGSMMTRLTEPHASGPYTPNPGVLFGPNAMSLLRPKCVLPLDAFAAVDLDDDGLGDTERRDQQAGCEGSQLLLQLHTVVPPNLT